MTHLTDLLTAALVLCLAVPFILTLIAPLLAADDEPRRIVH